MTEPAHSLKNTILLLVAHLGLDPKRVTSRMSPRRRFGRISVANRACSCVHVVDEAGAQKLGIALPAFVIDTASRPQAHPTERSSRSVLVVHVRTYRDGSGTIVRYVDVDTAEDLLRLRYPLTGRIDVPRSDGMRERIGHRWDSRGAGIGEHPADI